MEIGSPRGPGSPPSIFFTLMVGAPGYPSAPARGALSMFLSVDGGDSWIFSFGASQGARRRCFLASMVGASGSTALAPPSESIVDVFHIDGGCSQISVSTSQGGPSSTFLSVDGRRSRIYSSGTSHGVHRRHFLALMVGTPGSTAPTPPRDPVVNIFLH
jgi:hypothetical protein